MKTNNLILAAGICIATFSCNSNNNKPENPIIKIHENTLVNSYGANFTTKDEYYEGNNGEKIYHGHCKTFFISGELKRDDIYEHGKMVKWTEYNKFGEIVDSGK